MNDLDDILKLYPAEFETHWQEIDSVIGRLPTVQDQVKAWEMIVSHMESEPVSKGMPYFRLGILHLLTNANESRAIRYLERAYQEDQSYGPERGLIPHRMGAYRLLALVKGYLQYLQSQSNWETAQLKDPHRKTLVRTLLATYDKSLVHILDMEGYTYQAFFTLIRDRGLSRFAIENYFCAEHLLELFFLRDQHIVKHTDEYPLARAIVGLLAGVVEAILADRLPNVRGKSLGYLVTEAHRAGVIQIGTKLAALSSLMLYLRNHIHADREASRTEYFIDINVAKGCKVALDWVINELLKTARQ